MKSFLITVAMIILSACGDGGSSGSVNPQQDTFGSGKFGTARFSK